LPCNNSKTHRRERRSLYPCRRRWITSSSTSGNKKFCICK
jgi:hypothetical protein